MEEHAIEPVDTEETRPTARRLNARERIFVDAYLGEAEFIASKAAAIAGYSASSDHSLEVEGSRLLRRAEVAQAIDQALSARDITQERTLSLLSRSLDGAIEDHSWGASASLLTLSSKITGLLSEGASTTNVLVLPEGITAAELRQLAYPEQPITVETVETLDTDSPNRGEYDTDTSD